MTNIPAFFVYGIVNPKDFESAYADLAKLCGTQVLSREKRIYSITFDRDGEVWTATVGEKLLGKKQRTSHIQGRAVERTTELSDPAIVLGIFPGNPSQVVTTASFGYRSAWTSPFLVGKLASVIYFKSHQVQK